MSVFKSIQNLETLQVYLFVNKFLDFLKSLGIS